MSHEPPEMTAYIEKRKFERAYFSSEDNVTGIIIVPGQEKPLISGTISTISVGQDSAFQDTDGNISNISLGGAYLILKRDKALHLETGNTLTLREIQASILCNLELNIGMTIRRIHNYEFVEHIGLGCEFTSISDKSLEIIKELVQWGLSATLDKCCPTCPA